MPNFRTTILRRIVRDSAVTGPYQLAVQARDALSNLLTDTDAVRDPQRAARTLTAGLEVETDPAKQRELTEALIKLTGPSAQAVASNAQRQCVEGLLLLRKRVEAVLDPLTAATQKIATEVITAEIAFFQQFGEPRQPTPITVIVESVLGAIDAERKHLAQLRVHPTHWNNLCDQHQSFFSFIAEGA